jgi:hypothetical protein
MMHALTRWIRNPMAVLLTVVAAVAPAWADARECATRARAASPAPMACCAEPAAALPCCCEGPGDPQDGAPRVASPGCTCGLAPAPRPAAPQVRAETVLEREARVRDSATRGAASAGWSAAIAPEGELDRGRAAGPLDRRRGPPAPRRAPGVRERLAILCVARR